VTISRTVPILLSLHNILQYFCKTPGYKAIAHDQKTVIYPHAIVYDFEAYLDKTKRYKPTANATYESVHVPISVSVGDTMDSQLAHLCELAECVD